MSWGNGRAYPTATGENSTPHAARLEGIATFQYTDHRALVGRSRAKSPPRNRHHTMDSRTQPIPDTFVAQVRDAYAHLYDLAHLVRHDLTKLLSENEVRRGNGRELRSLLLATVERLRPAENVARSDRTWRPYLILTQRYVDGYSQEETMADLHISLRQLQREHRKGLLATAALLWPRWQASESDTFSKDDALEQEVDRLGLQVRSVDLSEIVGSVLPSAQALAQAHGVRLSLPSTCMAAAVRVDPALLRPGILSLINALVALAPEAIEIDWEVTPQQALLHLDLLPQIARSASVQQALERIEAVRSLASAQGASIQVVIEAERLQGLTITLPTASGARVLIIDDNERVLQLFERYLCSDGIGSHGVCSAAEARAFLEREQPRLVVLDVMMRDVDGWQFLQELRSNADMDTVPIIVCSVMNEPELAAALGAQRFVKKPVARPQMLEAVQQVLAAYSPADGPVTAR